MALLLLEYLGDVPTAGTGVLIAGLASKTLNQFVPFLSAGLIEDTPAYQRRRKPNVGS